MSEQDRVIEALPVHNKNPFEELPNLYQRDLSIEGVILNQDDIDELSNLLEKQNGNASALEVEVAVKQLSPDSDVTKENLQTEADKAFRINYSISDVDEKSSIEGVDRLKLKDFNTPNEIKTIYLSTGGHFNRIYGRYPNNYVNIFLDFRRQSLALDLKTLPSNPTENRSCLNVVGYDEAWVISTYEKLTKFFRDRATKRKLLHGSGTYDFVLYLILVPLFLFYATRYEKELLSWLPTNSQVLTVGVYVYILIIIMFVFRQLFYFARWLYPTVEYVSGKLSSPTKYRTILTAIFSATFIGVIVDVVNSIFASIQ